MKPTSRFLAALVVPVLAASVLRADSPTVAVLDFTASGASASEAVAVTGFVRASFVRSGDFTVVDKKNMDRIMQEQAFQQTGCTSSDCAVKLGKLLNVRKMCVGEYTMLGGVRFLTASLVDVESGKIERTAKVKGFEVANADDAADHLVGQLEGKESYVPPQTQTPPPEQGGNAYKTPEQNYYEQRAPVAAAPANPGQTYLMLYIGPTMAAGLSNYRRVSDYTWSSYSAGAYVGDPTFEVHIPSISLAANGPGFGARFGGLFGGFQFDVELDHSSYVTPAQNVTENDTYYAYDYYGIWTQYNPSYTFSMPDQFFTITTTEFGFNMYGYFPGDVIQPYLGGGILFMLINTQSKFQVDENGNELNATSLGFDFQLPIGLRVFPSKKFFLWAEIRPAISLMLDYKTGPSNLVSSDGYDIGKTMFNLGCGFIL